MYGYKHTICGCHKQGIDGTHKFKTTEKGLNYLKMHNEIGELLLTTIKITN